MKAPMRSCSLNFEPFLEGRAPAEYLASREIFPSGATPELLRPHFLADSALQELQSCGRSG